MEKNIESYCFCDFFMTFLSLKNDVNVPSKSTNKQKNSRRSLTKITGSASGSEYRSESGSGSISPRYGSADLDPYQNFMDPQQCVLYLCNCLKLIVSYIFVEMKVRVSEYHSSFAEVVAWNVNSIKSTYIGRDEIG
jgi:hypothetical protein